jgi:hypothetical protein
MLVKNISDLGCRGTLGLHIAVSDHCDLKPGSREQAARICMVPAILG